MANFVNQIAHWEQIFEKKILELDFGNDPAHDLAHFKRVVNTAKKLCHEERAKLEVVLPAAWLHDFVNVPKNDPRRSMASRLSAQAATEFLETQRYPAQWLEMIGHAIEAHSFSAQIEPRTLEAKIVQDADRLDGLGAIGIARCFSVAGLLKRRIYDPLDPFANQGRGLNDLDNTLDHFYVKLFRTAQTLQTDSGRAEGTRRAGYMKGFLNQLSGEIGIESPP